MNTVATPTESDAVGRTLATAQRHCGDHCRAIHGLWPILRLLDLNTTPLHHQAFFATHVARFVRRGARRILICGAADAAMLAVTHACAAQAGARPDIAVLDRCATPLFACDDFARRHGLAVSLTLGDILEHDAPPYDLVVTHSFLGQFDPAARRRLAARWRALTASNGAVISVNRLRPSATGIIRFNDAERARFVATLVQRWAASPWREAIAPDALQALAQAYANSHAIHPIHSAAEVTAWFADAGFGAVDCVALTPAAAPGPAGPTLRGDARYLGFVAAHDGPIAMTEVWSVLRRGQRALLGLALACLTCVAAASEGDWRGQTLHIVVGFSPGGGYDAYARLLAPHLERLSGATVVVDNQSGAGGLTALNRLARTTPDGLTIGLANGEGAVIAQLTDRPAIAYDMAAFRVVARITDEQHVLMVRHGLGDSLQQVLARPGPLKFSAMTRPDNLGDYAAVFCAALKHECRIVTGYAGSAEAARAVMTGEVDAITISDGSGSAYARGGHAHLVATLGPTRTSLAPDVPALFDVVQPSPADRRWFDFRLGIKAVGRILIAPPGIAAERLASLRALFRRVLDDPQLRADAERQQRPIRPQDPDEVERAISNALRSLPPADRESLRQLLLRDYS